MREGKKYVTIFHKNRYAFHYRKSQKAVAQQECARLWSDPEFDI